DAYAVRSLKERAIPFWNPFQGLGQPFLAVGATAILYPVNWLHSAIPPAWWDLIFLLNWCLGSLFLYALLRIYDVEPQASMIGALAFFACGTVEIYLACREILAVAAWWPLLLYAIERTYRQPNWRARHVVLAVGVYCSVTAGQPESTFLSLLVASGYALARAILERKHALSLIFRLIPGAVAGLLISAPHWLNFADYAFTSFSEHTPGAGKGLIHMPFRTIASYFFPYFYGRLQHYPFGPAAF